DNLSTAPPPLPLRADRTGRTGRDGTGRDGTSMVVAVAGWRRWPWRRDPSSDFVGTGPGDKSFPRPARDLPTVGHIIRGPVIAGHRGRGQGRGASGAVDCAQPHAAEDRRLQSRP